MNLNDSNYWIFYCNRPDWADVKPLAQDATQRTVVCIAYSEKYQDVHDYLRAVMNAGEVSERALLLTGDAIKMNPANYSAWVYRRHVLDALNSDLQAEMRFVGDSIEENPKNYQVWYHRKWLADRVGDGQEELQLTGSVISGDAKNYHAWEHRQWALERFEVWEKELAYTEDLLQEDMRNNSAWNQRHFLISRTTGFTEEVVERECEFVEEIIRQAATNESAWNYLRGVHLSSGGSLAKRPRLRRFCEFMECDAKAANSPHTLACLVQVYEDLLEENSNEGRSLGATSSAEVLRKAVELCERLATELDRVRINYWKYIQRSLITRFASSEDQSAGDKPSRTSQ